jgi:hypothetical protein
MTTRRRPEKDAAFAAVTAIVLLGLVASALAAMAMMFAADARRTRSAAAEAQLRQLLLAGAADAQQRLAKGESSFDVTIAAPGEGEIRVSAAAAAPTTEGDAARAVIVVATLGPRRAEQTLRFTREAGGEQKWKLAAVEPRS